MMGGRPSLSAPSSGLTNRLNSSGVVGGRGGAQVRPAASSLSIRWDSGGKGRGENGCKG
jgi:hypothetical protein